ncbi:ABC transporter substrate-binding protein [Aureibacillus halotolerans]|uniref:Carbohydrate ABC transporter substrate-binding protein (CUT1 family) n=1 Tax=Aureibacillus halotolerans TaxID=1508390 RepID=A0A4R6U3Q8_9BACI|nr:extracellular solute-binding protein [Aureibacillus halotolerans]TDQ41040.1 carbohydrate ABC transporter substrate-binding protein (CUT1 family) [Aureibacillus halotolerans]
MRKLKFCFLFLVLSIFVLSGCTGGGSLTTQNVQDNPPSEPSDTGTEEAPVEGEATKSEGEGTELTSDPSLAGEVTFWSFSDDIYDDIVTEFNKVYPNIKVKVVILEFGELHDKLQTTLAAGQGAPDLVQVETNQFPRYVTGGLLVDFLQEPYNAGRYQDQVSEYTWERWKSLDGKQLLGMPWDVTPGVFYYRADIFEQMGLPSEPEALGEFIQDKENFMMAAQTLAANGKFILEWRDLPVNHYGDQVGYFDSEFNWLRNDERTAELLDYVKRGTQVGWAAQMSGLGSDEGRQLIKQGKLVAVQNGSWAARDLKKQFPEQEGQWRATRMPLGVSVGLGGSTFVMPSQSQNKEAAWAFNEWMTTSEDAWKIFVERSVQPSWKHITSLDWYKSHTNPYLGGQLDFELYDTLDDAIPVRRYTPLDGKGWPIYIEGIHKAIDENVDSKTILQQIEDNVHKQLGADIQELKASIGQ